MKPTKTSRIDLSIRSSAGFSIVELMVVVIVISALAALSSTRLMTMVARGRQAEAKTNLSSIHQLQSAYQLHADNFAEWAMGTSGASTIGNIGTATKNCGITDTAGPGKVAGKDGAHKLGWKPKGCEEMRYGYWVIVEDKGGVERYFAVAYASSNTLERIFPTCDGARANASPINHEKQGSYSTLVATNGTAILGGVANGGDLLGISEEKEWQHADIIEACQ